MARRTDRRATTGALLLALTIFALSPFGTLRFDANPRTLESPGSAAGHALRLLTEKRGIVARPEGIIVATAGVDRR